MDTPFVEVGSKKNIDYLLDCLIKFNRGANEVILRSIGGGVSKGLRVAQILLDHFPNISITNTNIEKVEIESKKAFCLKTQLNFSEISKTDQDKNEFVKELKDTQGKLVIKFPIYSILLDYLLANNSVIYISNSDKSEIKDPWTITLNKTMWDFECAAEIGSKDREIVKKMHNYICSAYYRSGLLVPYNWKEVAFKLSQTDDVVIGVDTNILLNATLSEHFLCSLYLINAKDYVQTPNWMLIVIPSAVLHELEQGTNSRDAEGYLSMRGRVGFRALGEILELTQCIDLTGISLIIFGEANPILDLRVEVRGLREDYAKSSDRFISPKSSSGDTIIRDQFKQLLKQLDFFGGSSFFLTTDKTNAALAQCEGLQAIYYKTPHYLEAQGRVAPFSLACNSDAEKIVIPVLMGKLIYELAVQFGAINISWDKSRSHKPIEVACDKKGESLDHWLHKNILISKQDFEKLCNIYQGRIPLEIIRENVWEEIVKKLVKGDIY